MHCYLRRGPGRMRASAQRTRSNAHPYAEDRHECTATSWAGRSAPVWPFPGGLPSGKPRRREGRPPQTVRSSASSVGGCAFEGVLCPHRAPSGTPGRARDAGRCGRRSQPRPTLTARPPGPHTAGALTRPPGPHTAGALTRPPGPHTAGALTRPPRPPARARPARLDRPPRAPYLRGLDRLRAELPFRAGPPRRRGLRSTR